MSGMRGFDPLPPIGRGARSVTPRVRSVLGVALAAAAAVLAVSLARDGSTAAAQTNSAPVFDDGTAITLTLTENTSARHWDTRRDIGSAITATDSDSGDKVRYFLSGTDAALFSVRGQTGQLRTWYTYFDYESSGRLPVYKWHYHENSYPKFRAGAGPYNVTLKAVDNSGASDTIAVTINITDVAETPRLRIYGRYPLIGSQLTGHVEEWPGPQSDFDWEWFHASDPDDRDTYRVVPGATSAEFIPTSGVLGRHLLVDAQKRDGTNSFDILTDSRVGCQNVSFPSWSYDLSNTILRHLGLSVESGKRPTPQQMLRLTRLVVGGVRDNGSSPVSGPGGSVNLTTVNGLECAVNLRYLRLLETNVSSINLSNFHDLQVLDLQQNNLSSIDVTANDKLVHLDVSGNDLTGLDLTDLGELKTLHAYDNDIATITSFTGLNTKLQFLNVENNELTSIRVTNLTHLRNLHAGDNQLTALDVSGSTALDYIDLSSNADPVHTYTFTVTGAPSDADIAFTAAERVPHRPNEPYGGGIPTALSAGGV